MSNEMLHPVIFGTAGHIDHGKTTLVKALTGQDADRLPEEKARGITIDLGFAHMSLPSQQRIAFIDVPGHERFVRNMVAGVHGMDAVLLVVAADEGIMPQTEEHLAILRLLGVRHGLTVVTKADLVDDEMLDLVRALIEDTVQGTFLEHQPIMVVDAVSGRGIDNLIAELERLADAVERRQDGGHVRLPIDRVFSVKGFGTVVTGTLVAGRVVLEDALELVPGKEPVRVRGVQVHNHNVREAWSGQRVAVNLAGVDRVEVERGQVLASPGTLQGVDVAVVQLELLETSPTAEDKTRVHVHAGTAEALARIYFFDRDELEGGSTAFAELRFETPLALTRQDRFLIRSYSPVVTIGGGVAVEVGIHHRKKEPGLVERLARLSQGDDLSVIQEALRTAAAPEDVSAVAKTTGLELERVRESVGDPSLILLDGRYLWDAAKFQDWTSNGEKRVARYVKEHPIKPGMPQEELKAQIAAKWPLRIFQTAVQHNVWVLDREWIRLSPEPPVLSSADVQAIARVYGAISAGGLRPPAFSELVSQLGLPPGQFDDIIEHLYLGHRVLRLEDGLAVTREAYEEGRRAVDAAIRQDGPKSTAELKDVLGVSRRHAVLFLELLDRERVTRRVGDNRELVG